MNTFLFVQKVASKAVVKSLIMRFRLKVVKFILSIGLKMDSLIA